MEKTVSGLYEATTRKEINQTGNQLRGASRLANQWLRYAASFWFVAVLAGQWFFFYYIITFYGFSVINDNMEVWNRWEVFGKTPYQVGDFTGNLAFAAHAIGAGFVAFGGALQLLPQMRRHFPKFHKINGYLYLLTVFLLSVSGFYLVWIRDQHPITLDGIGTSINGILILAFTFFCARTAIKKDIRNHRKWALRLFLVSNAQWFLRLGVFSYLVTGTSLGLDPKFGDPFFPMWTFGCFVVPLVMAELYFLAGDTHRQIIKSIAACSLLILTVLMLVGMLGFTPFLIMVMSGGEISI
ncbi:DUF2306 domain-containing protein [Pseudoalteromonas luteoviolacea]|uniref:DUF2306 domain-containing protein n=1 Tax=Pseudoalteromonas luteoviolacea NCIMB 1942 TaxID=1365253 RepID=A0A167G8P0_9GAMM|nr:DUF2306 domain-containing protein [Pseudoalteromonas luteoviolacea]KZN54320.1 hypothetical protein N482_05580 [Pseudoalteromonas luteoviolacea NCIMB 1942]KZX01049.1 hypothetical protein JL49_07965 [Pseudoalteromonas luteoviolacea]